MAVPASPKTKKTVEEIYQKKSQREHILIRPETYVGPIEAETEDQWIYNGEAGCMQKKKLTWGGGFIYTF